MSAMHRLCFVALVVALGSCRPEVVRAPRSSEEPSALRYNVTYVREPELAIDVEVVRSHNGPQDFMFTVEGVVDTLQVSNDKGQVQELSVEDSGVTVPPDTRFIRYRYPLQDSRGWRWRGLFEGMAHGDALIISGKSWLIRPRVAELLLRAELSIQGTDVLLPWQPGPDGLYQLRAEDLVDSGFHGFGGRRCQAHLPDAVLDVAIQGPLTHLKDEQVCEWLRQRAEEVRTIRRSFPYPRISVIVYPVPEQDDADIFGMVMWSAPPSIGLLLGQDTRPGSFSEDWTALHELLHLTHPTILPRTPWISEGLATYLTELARARSGRFSPERAWKEMLRGFERGKRQARGRTMQQMLDEDRPPGIYWVGAFFALRVDVALRKATGNQRGLQDVLELLATQGSTSTVARYGAAVDAVAGQPLFTALLEAERRRPAFAGLEGLLEDLGVTPTPGGVKLQQARNSPVREALDGKSTAGSR
jgi:hypothetical protein